MTPPLKLGFGQDLFSLKEKFNIAKVVFVYAWQCLMQVEGRDVKGLKPTFMKIGRFWEIEGDCSFHVNSWFIYTMC